MVVLCLGGLHALRVNRYGGKDLLLECYGAWCGKTCKEGYGWVLRDFAGLLQAAGGEGGLIFNNPMMVEVAAVRAALQVCLELGCIEVGVESDSQTVIRMANREYVIDATLECFFHDIRFLASQLGRVTFACVKRHGNAAAHAIALYVTSHGGAFR